MVEKHQLIIERFFFGEKCSKNILKDHLLLINKSIMIGYSSIFRVSDNSIKRLIGSKDNELFYKIQESEYFVIRNNSIKESPENLSVKQALTHLIFEDKINLNSTTRREAYTSALLSICEFFGERLTSLEKDIYFETLDYIKLLPSISNEVRNAYKFTLEYIDSKYPIVEIFENLERIQLTLTGLIQENINNKNDPTLSLISKEGYHIKLPFTDKKLLNNYKEGQVLDCVLVYSSFGGKRIKFVREYNPFIDKAMLQLIHFKQKDLLEMINILKPLNTKDIHKWENDYSDEDYLIWSLIKLKTEIEYCLLEKSEIIIFQR